MPLRSVLKSANLRNYRQLHGSAIRRAGGVNHYETLQIPPHATPAEVKKSFYALSKKHHPDHNPNDPDASKRFVKISEAYGVLGAPAKRQQYDRDVMRTEQQHAAGSANRPSRGSYSSSGPAGGRPASGLSRRKTHFQGPPPSFFRNGQWGSFGAKRRTAQEGGTGASPSSFESAGGSGQGQSPLSQDNDVPHFDKEAHFRTHSNQDRRRQHKMAGNYESPEPATGVLANFIIVSSIISAGVIIPTLIWESFRGSKDSNR